MKPIDQQDFDLATQHAAPSGAPRSGWAAMLVAAVRRAFQTRTPISAMSTRMRRDVGIKEHEAERDAAARAPLIR